MCGYLAETEAWAVLDGDWSSRGTSATTVSTNFSVVDGSSIGAISLGAYTWFCNGQLAHVTIAEGVEWTQGEVEEAAAGADPSLMRGVSHYWPIWGGASPETDRPGNGYSALSMTLNNAPAESDQGPPVYIGAPPATNFYVPAVAAGLGAGGLALQGVGI